MATITSAQSGNFSATSTWTGGVVPTNGDIVNIAASHTVEYDLTTPIATGYNDLYVYGIFTNSDQAHLRMNGRLYVKGGGTLWLKNRCTVDWKGTAAESHCLFQENESGASVIIEGSDGMPATTLVGEHVEGSTVLNLASANNFAVGEWIAVYENNFTSTTTADGRFLRDEGFWIHDIDGNSVYFRLFVSPWESQVLEQLNNTVRITNPKVFRTGQTVIFGTGSNRNISTITDIDYISGTLTLSNMVVGSVTGEILYLTATEKIKSSNAKVRKVATVTTTSSAAGSSSITLANANMFQPGDDVWVEARSLQASLTDYQDDQFATYVWTVSSVDGNTLTFTSPINYAVVSGALVTRLTRDIVFKPVVEGTDNYSFFRDYLDNYSNTTVLKDVYFKKCGSSYGQIEGGVTVRGFATTNNSSITPTQTYPLALYHGWLEGVTYDQGSTVRDWSGIWLYSARYTHARCCFVHNANSGIGPYYQAGICVYNSISVKNDTAGLRCEGINEYHEIAYNYASRNENSFRLYVPYEWSSGYHDLISDGSTQYAVVTGSSQCGPVFYRHKHTSYIGGVTFENSFVSFLYSYLKQIPGFINSDAGTGTGQVGSFYAGHLDRGNTGYQIFSSIEDRFEIDGMRQWLYNTERVWDVNEGAWRVYWRPVSDFGTGAWTENFFLPAGTSAVISLDVKLAPNFSGTYPLLAWRTAISAIIPNVIGNIGGENSNYFTGGQGRVSYTSSATSVYETKTLTIEAKPFPRYVEAGLTYENSSTAEGVWMKNFKLKLDKPYANSQYMLINSGNITGGSQSFSIGTSTSEQIIRLGGRIK